MRLVSAGAGDGGMLTLALAIAVAVAVTGLNLLHFLGFKSEPPLSAGTLCPAGDRGRGRGRCRPSPW